MFAASVLLLLLSVALAIGQAVGEQSSSISSPPLFTKYEQAEHDLVWKVMSKACFGKWTGALQCFRMNKATNSPIISNEKELLNFRLWAKADTDRMGKTKDTGTWKAWNLQRKGDEIVVPLRRLPISSKPSQLKIGLAKPMVTLATMLLLSEYWC